MSAGPGLHDVRTERYRMPQEEWDIRMRQARARAEWELGDPTWAGVIIAAFMEPDTDEHALALEMGDGIPDVERVTP